MLRRVSAWTASLINRCWRVRALSYEGLNTRPPAVTEEPARAPPSQQLEPWRPRPRCLRTPICSLDPEQLQLSDLLDISGLVRRAACLAEVGEATISYKDCGRNFKGERRHIPFPPGSVGFLYLHRRPNSHPAAGEIRFRVVDVFKIDSSTPTELFKGGSDLLAYEGYQPWRIHMLQTYWSNVYEPFRKSIVRQGLLTEDEETETSLLLSKVPMKRLRGNSIILERVTDPFVLSLSVTRKDSNRHSIIGLHQGAIVRHRLANRQLRREPQHLVPPTYHGNALVRFELSGPDRELVLRVLKLLDQPGPDGVFQLPEEGAKVVIRYQRSKARDNLLNDQNLIPPSSMKILQDAYPLSGDDDRRYVSKLALRKPS
ncbi:hypothetical protein DFP72DRAFT_1069601 [Ephemerocybe angulata]|uniref:Uncharacterized protein n=1 Tax=Ephemerocybe angulata TaxID=980116 RepID=A0A8H6HVT2_9AGAR|nr:hypothetical protein DFP72DRAFT_1069601 [Tulosesus angulatus]